MNILETWKFERQTFLDELSQDPDYVLNNLNHYISWNNDEICSEDLSVLMNNYLIKVIVIPKLYINMKELPSSFLRYINENNCGFQFLHNSLLFGSDQFTNELLIAYFLQYIYNEDPLSPILTYYTYSVCGQNIANNIPNPQEYINEPMPNLYSQGSFNEPTSLLGGSVRLQGLSPSQIALYESIIYKDQLRCIFIIEKPNMGSLERLSLDYPEYGENRYVEKTGSIYYIIKPKITLEIFKQLIIILDALQRDLNFQHGNLTANKIFLNYNPINFDTYGIPIKLDFTCKLSDFRNSSLSLSLGLNHQKYRFYSQIPSFEVLYSNTPSFMPFLQYYNNEYVYIINDSFTYNMLSQIRAIGIPFYSSFDIYTLFLSILSFPQFHYSVFPDLKHLLWDPLWFPVDREVMYYRLLKLMHSNSQLKYETIFNTLRNIRLKCQVSTNLIDTIKNIINI